MATLFFLAEEIRRCTACPLYKNATLAVPGEGQKDAKIMLVGEAPGEEEDRRGLPFAGRSGKVLDEMLALAGLDRKQVFITNTVKHRPQENRIPTAGEIKTCKGLWLDRQIEILKQKLIVILGAVALKTLVKEASLTKSHGKFLEKKGQKYFVTFHPSAALRYPSRKKKMEEDFRRLREKIKI